MTRIEKTLVNIDSVLSQSRSLIQKLTNFIQKDCLVEVAFESSVVLVISGEYSCVCVCVILGQRRLCCVALVSVGSGSTKVLGSMPPQTIVRRYCRTSLSFLLREISH